ncbi:MAG: pitrilysin family protein [Spirochaetaceae bacterium]|nr:pitrilysin family protein [Spirochaetaceae bacterium]
MIERGTLANGVTLLCEPVESTETCAVGFWFPTGSRDEQRHERGLSHFLEHMLFKGTECRSALDIAVQIDRVGGNINAFTDRESTCFFCTLPAAHAGLAVDVLCDMVRSATLAEADIQKEKVVVRNEIRAADDSPEEQGYQLFLERLWGSHPLAATVAGREQDVARIDRDGLEAFYRHRYHPANLVVTAAGNLDFDAVAGIVNERLSAGGKPVAAGKRVPPAQHRSQDYADSSFQQAQIYAATTLAPPAAPATYYALLVLSTAFGESMSSRLFQRIREDAGLCYSVETIRSHYSDVWKWGIYANAMPELAPRLLAALNRELHRLADHPPSGSEVDDAISHLTGSMVFAREDMETRMKRIAGQYQLFGSVMELDQAANLLHSVTADDVAAVAARLLQPGRFNLLVYGAGDSNGSGRARFDW